jgi:hypothetical protein
MEKFKNKYEIILGFATIIISLSAFKTELDSVNINLGFTEISLAKYFLYCICGLSISLYLYVIERIFNDTKIGQFKIFDWLIKLAFFLFSFIVLTPILILINIVVFEFYNLIVQFKIESLILNKIIELTPILLIILASSKLTEILFKLKKVYIQLNLTEQILNELVISNKLYQDGYYSQSILESFKVLETHLFKKITEKNIRVSRYRFDEIVNISLNENIIENKDLENINNLKNMRNLVAHTNISNNKEDAEKILEFVKYILNK